MTNQPIPKKILETHEIEPKPFYSLVIDGDSLLNISFSADKRLNRNGICYGGVFQFLLQLKIIMQKKSDFSFIYVVWDPYKEGGQKRYDIYPPYKGNRGKVFSNENIKSDYYDQMDKFINRTLEYNVKNKEKQHIKLSEKEEYNKQKSILQSYLDELFIRQIGNDLTLVEGDDLIAQIAKIKSDQDYLYIVSGDGDVAQLIDNQRHIAIYHPRLKKFLNEERYISEFSHSPKNIATIKTVIGDTSDNIKGILGVGPKTLTEIMGDDLKNKEVKIWDVIEKTKILSEERKLLKKKPKVAYENILSQKSDCMHNGKVFEINNILVNLKNPLLTEEAIEEIDNIMYAPLDISDRSLSNLYKLMLRDGIDELLDSNKFSNFFSTFTPLREKEIKLYEKWLKENS